MDQRKRNIYVSFRQKKKLVELVSKHPQLLSSRGKTNFSFQDAQSAWQDISRQCNDIPGAKKTWRQWKKTWQDLRSKYKKRLDPRRPTSLSSVLTTEEREALGITSGDGDSSYQEATELILLDQSAEDNFDSTMNENDSLDNLSEHDTKPESPMENDIYERKGKKNIKQLKNNSKHSNCYFNCNTLADQEQRKIQIKEDYINFKKEYLRQKLKLLKEQTEALKTIAKELCDK